MVGRFIVQGLNGFAWPATWMSVEKPLSPAAKAGVQAGDVISSIEGQNAAGLTVSQVSEKLRGAAGALGANDVAGVSQRLELALRQGAPAEDLTQALADALARLAVAGGRAVAAHARDQAQAQDRQPTAAAPTPRQLQSLGALLQRQDLDALDHYGELAAGIRQLAGVESEAALRDAVQSLDFARAQRLLDAITPLAAES